MPVTYSLIASNTLSSSAASVTFSSIPNTFTDLVLRVSVRGNNTSTIDSCLLTTNASTSTNHSYTYIRGDGATPLSGRTSADSSIQIGLINGANATSNTFTNLEIYIPNYQASANKPISISTAQENNNTTAYIYGEAALLSSTSAITSVTFSKNALQFVSGSSFFLYGIKNS